MKRKRNLTPFKLALLAFTILAAPLLAILSIEIAAEAITLISGSLGL